MTTRNFEALFAPRSLALIGASERAGSVGAVLARNLFAGGFSGPILPVNPRRPEIMGRPCYPDVAALPHAPDLAILATPAPVIPDIVRELGERGCRAAIVISTGFAAPALRKSLLDASQPHLVRLVGPNCLGMISPHIGLNASFAHLMPKAGDIALLTQSGAIATSLLDWASGRGIGFSHLISVGEMADVDFGDLLDHLALDRQTRAILLYVENVTHARKFMSAARIAARAKPVIVVKSGRGARAAAAAASHSGALSGADDVYEAAFRRAGMLRVQTLRDLFDAAATLAAGTRIRGDRLTILTNGGGLGVLATDALEALGARMAPLSEAAKRALAQTLPAAWSGDNPIDILGDADEVRYERALDIVLAQPDYQDAVLVMNCPTGVADNAAAAQAVLRAREKRPHAPLLACWMGQATAEQPRRLLAEGGVPSYETPDEAARAFFHLYEYGRNQRALLETPAACEERPVQARDAVRRVLDRVRADKRVLLTAPESNEILAAYGVPVVATAVASNAGEVAARAAEVEAPLALKILSRDITHKSDVGGVRLDLPDARAAAAAAAEMTGRIGRLKPDARIDGFIVQPMIRRPRAHELIVGLSVDRTFGPTLLFGQGGVAVEVVRDRAMGLPPLNAVLARDMIERTRVARLLHGYRDRPAADIGAIARVLIALSDLAADFPDIAEADVNPLLADEHGVLALDARIVLAEEGAVRPIMSIRPYPSELARDLTTADGTHFLLRPIRPDDEARLMAFGATSDPEHLRLRFHGPVRIASHENAARLSQIDYDREMAFLAMESAESIAGVVRLVFDPNFETAEFAIIVRSDLHGRGLGRALLQEALRYAKSRGAHTVWGDVLPENTRMLALARQLGAQMHLAPGAVRATFGPL